MPNLADLRRLAAEIGSAGLPVDLEVAGLPDLPPGVELAAYRIVQEALTNALRHAHARLATVRLETTADALRIVVRDDGRGRAPGARSGHGLIGMRERVGMVGGTLDAGPRPGGGFRISALLPLKPAH